MAQVALMGGGLGNVPILRALRARGHEVTVFSWPGNTRDSDRLQSLGVRHFPLSAPLELTWDFDRPENDVETDLVLELSARARERRADHLLWLAEDGVYALGLNRHLFEPYGIRLHVPDSRDLRAVQVRPEFARLCARHGIPSPQPLGGLDRTPPEYPVIAKLATSAGSSGVRLVRSPAELADLRLRWAGSGQLYRYVPGTREPSLTVVLDDLGRPAVATWLRKLRYAGGSVSTCVETTAPPPEAGRLLAFVGTLGLRGICSAQLKRDSGSGELNVVEVNTRPGQNTRILVALWERLGVEWLDHVLGIAPAPAGGTTGTAGVVGLSPVEDAAAVLKHFARRPGGAYRRRDVVASVGYALRRRPTVDVTTRVLAANPGAGLPIAVRQFRDAYRKSTDFIPYGDLRGGAPVSVPRRRAGAVTQHPTETTFRK